MANLSREYNRLIVILGIVCLFMSTGAISRGDDADDDDEIVFNILTFGAKADGKTDDSSAFIQAWRGACHTKGKKTRILVPGGKEFTMGEVVFAGPCVAESPIVIEINGNLSAILGPGSYSKDTWVLINRVDGLKVTGTGTFIGHGTEVWRYADREDLLPVSLIFQEVHNSEISNLNFLDAMGYHTRVSDSYNVRITNLTIIAPEESPNTDGIHLTNNTNLSITDTYIRTGDDCVSIGEGNVDVIIRNVFCGPGHGLSIGSLGKRVGETSVSGITIENCTLTKSTNGARIKSYHSSPRLDYKNIIYKDLIMIEVKNPIIIDQHYDSRNKSQQSSVKISNVKFLNIKGTTISRNPILLNCSSLFPCENIQFAGIDLRPKTQLEKYASACSNAKFKVNGPVNPPMPASCK